MIGQKLEQYEIREQIGRGAMGTVYRAYDTALDREVAVKVLSPMAAPGPTQVQRFYQEARAAAGLSHPNVVTIYDIGEHEDLPYFVMELLEGRSAGDALEKEGRMAWRQALEIVRQICSALEVAHERGVLHRDIKPDNIWLHSDGRVKVLDFGIARFSAASTLTQAGETMGTPEYMAPEQIMGETLDGRTDLYAVGTLLYALLTGGPPFSGPNPITVIYRQMEETPVPPGRIVSDLPVVVERVVMQSLEKDPGQRYASVAELGAELEALLEGREVEVEGKNPVPEEVEEGQETEVRFESRLVGREQELKALEAALLRLGTGEGGAVLVGGEAGIGKTRLATEALQTAEEHGGILVLKGICMPGEAADPYLPFVEVLVQGMGSGTEVEREEALAFLRAEAPELGELSSQLGAVVRAGAGPSASWGESVDPEATVAVSRERLFEAVSQVLLFFGRRQPVAVLLDDLHWADSGSLQLLHYLSRSAQKYPLLFVGTYRTEDLLPDAAGGGTPAGECNAANEPRRAFSEGRIGRAESSRSGPGGVADF